MKILECFIVFLVVEMWGGQQNVTGLLQQLENVYFRTSAHFFMLLFSEINNVLFRLSLFFLKSIYKLAKDGWHDICEMAASQREALGGYIP